MEFAQSLVRASGRRDFNAILAVDGDLAISPSLIFVAPLAIAVSAWMSLRFTLMEPRNPASPSLWPLIKGSIGCAVLIWVAEGAVIAGSIETTSLAGWAAPTALGLVMGPAIVPVHKITELDERSWLGRQYMKATGKLVDLATKAALMSIPAFLLWLFARDMDPVTKWLAVGGAACVISMLTRPLSRDLQPVSRDWTVPHPDWSGRMWRRRLTAIAAQLLWFALVFPIVIDTYDLEEPKLVHLLGYCLGWLISDDQSSPNSGVSDRVSQTG